MSPETESTARSPDGGISHDPLHGIKLSYLFPSEGSRAFQSREESEVRVCVMVGIYVYIYISIRIYTSIHI